MKNIGALITGWLNKYIVALEWIVLLASWVGVAWSVHHIDGLSVKAQESEHISNIAQAAPQIIHETQTITKVIHDAKDTCSSAAIPASIAAELRK